MRVLIDTNVILDVLIDRKEFSASAQKVFKLCEVKKIDGFISALSVPNIVYIMRKELDNDKIKSIVKKLSFIFNIAELRAEDLSSAIALNFGDYEDALHAAQAKRLKADYILTRNIKDFKNSEVPAIVPSEFLKKEY